MPMCNIPRPRTDDQAGQSVRKQLHRHSAVHKKAAAPLFPLFFSSTSLFTSKYAVLVSHRFFNSLSSLSAVYLPSPLNRTPPPILNVSHIVNAGHAFMSASLKQEVRLIAGWPNCFLSVRAEADVLRLLSSLSRLSSPFQQVLQAGWSKRE